MRFRKVIDEPIDSDKDGVNVAGRVNAVIDANIGETDSKTRTSSKQKTRVVQRGGKTIVNETVRDDDADTRA